MTDRVGQQLGNYRLSRLLGKGGFAEVYLGEHVYLKTPAAIKLLQTKVANEEDLQAFLAEAQTIAQLVHPHIVRVLDFGVDGDIPFLVMDYATGGSLRQRHPRGTPLPLTTIVPYIKQVAEALQYAHGEKFIHRDVKPENMLVGRREAVLLSDFGIALMAQSSRYQSTQDVIGTVAYMSPEQIQGKPRPSSDQYSLGIVVYEWLCGDRPFHGSFTELCTQHMFASPPPLREKIPTLSSTVEHVVMTALAKDPKQRFGSVQAFATALEQACQIAPSQQGTLPSEPAVSRERGAAVVPSALPQAASKSTPASQSAPPTLADMLSHLSLPKHQRGTVSVSRGRGLPRQWRVLLLGLALLVIAGSLGLFSIIRTHQLAPDNHATPGTAQMNATTTAYAATRIGAQANTAATITATTYYHSYVQATSRTPVLDDPLSDNSRGYKWNEGTNTIGSCSFSEGAYHVIPNKGYFIFCGPTAAPSLSDFAFQVHMKILKGEAGGIGFGNAIGGYFFYITPTGSYTLFTYNHTSNRITTLKDGLSVAIRTGLNQTNLIAVLAQGNTITLYVNNQYINSVVSSRDYKGLAGLSASAFVNPTEVVFSNAKAWLL